MKSGFTLIELSIVLVIIGLLVGGILTARNLIDNAKINKTVSILTQYSIGVSKFQSLFNGLPGDTDMATSLFGSVSGSCITTAGTGAQTCDGNNDGRIEYPVNNFTTIAKVESWRAWEHLHFSKVLTIPEYTGIQGTSCSAGYACTISGENLPESPMGEDTTISMFYYGSGLPGAVNRNVFAIGRASNHLTSFWEGVWSGQALTPLEASTIDRKIDDGMPYVGKIQNQAWSGSTNNCSNGSYSVGTGYDHSYTDDACVLLIDIDLLYEFD